MQCYEYICLHTFFFCYAAWEKEIYVLSSIQLLTFSHSITNFLCIHCGKDYLSIISSLLSNNSNQHNSFNYIFFYFKIDPVSDLENNLKNCQGRRKYSLKKCHFVNSFFILQYPRIWCIRMFQLGQGSDSGLNLKHYSGIYLLQRLREEERKPQ